MFQLLAFRTEMAEFLLSASDVITDVDSDSDDACPSSAKRLRYTPMPSQHRRSSGHHWPQMTTASFSSRCRNPGCSARSKVQCLQCKVNLCLTAERNCFVEFHMNALK